jgi:hypothetical protein
MNEPHDRSRDGLCKVWIWDDLRKRCRERAGGCGPALFPAPLGTSTPVNCDLRLSPPHALKRHPSSAIPSAP